MYLISQPGGSNSISPAGTDRCGIGTTGCTGVAGAAGVGLLLTANLLFELVGVGTLLVAVPEVIGDAGKEVVDVGAHVFGVVLDCGGTEDDCP